MSVTRREFGYVAAAAALQPSRPAAAPRLSGAVEAPVDHDRRAAGAFPLAYEWGRVPRPDLPTVLVVADAQQYFVQPGLVAALQDQLFGPELNVLGVIGRSRAPALKARLDAGGGRVDWPLAYRLLNSQQWVRDLALVIRRLGLRRGGLGLYGRSGGAHLIMEALTVYPDLADRAYVQAAVVHQLDALWGVSADRLWEELSAFDASAARDLASFIAARPERRREIVLTLQRQNFFEPLDGLQAARAAVARAFVRGDEAAIAEYRRRYQVDLAGDRVNTVEGAGAAVRLFEFAAPHLDPRSAGGVLRPDVEALFYYAKPVMEAIGSGAAVKRDWGRLRDQKADVLQFAGRWDHTCDYRTQIGLNGLTRNSRLVLLDDDHVFKRLGASGEHPGLLQAFFRHGARSAEFEARLARVAGLLWKEA